jgi:hypothetical protein
MRESWRVLGPVVLVGLTTGCVLPRSMIVGQTAAPIGRGAMEVGAFTGVQYASQTSPPFTSTDQVGGTVTTQERRTAFALPGAEANLQYGVSERLALNVHASPAGLQPGVKWTLNRSPVASVALLPAVAFGYGSVGGVTAEAGADGLLRERNPTTTTSFTFLGGLKLLVSHRGGFFAGVGYDFTLNRSLSSAVIGSGNVQDRLETLTVTTGHQLSASVGIDIAFGMVHLRPEVAVAVNPGLAMSVTTRQPPNETNASAGGGFGFAIFPGFTIAVASPRRAPTPAEEADERPTRQRAREDDAEDEEDSDDEAPTARPKRQQPSDDD